MTDIKSYLGEVTLYKRNAKGQPIFWSVRPALTHDNIINISCGIVGHKGLMDYITCKRDVAKEIISMINAKRKEGYKKLQDLYDNAPQTIKSIEELYKYLDNYLPKYNTHEDGKFIPMLCKTLENNKPFEKGEYFGQWKINGERCIITAVKQNDLFRPFKFQYRSREGVDWTDKLSYMDELIYPYLGKQLIEMMVEEEVGLDGEMYIPSFNINDINSFIKNTAVPEHKELQFWLYDLCMENMSAEGRQHILHKNIQSKFDEVFITREQHLSNQDRLVLLPSIITPDITEATVERDRFIEAGFEGIVVRDAAAEYQFGGRRNNAMLKYKKKLDGYFDIVGIDTDKRGLPVFLLKNDLNDEMFQCTYNASREEQLAKLHSDIFTYKAFVEYRERSGVKQVPFHAKIIKFETK